MAPAQSVRGAPARRSLIVKLRIPSLADIAFNQTSTIPPTAASSTLPQATNITSVPYTSDSSNPILDHQVATDPDSAADSASADGWSPEYSHKLADLCNSGMDDDDLIMLPQKQLKDVNLLQLRRTYNLRDLVDAYNVIHEGNLLHEYAVKKRFTKAFSVVAKRAGVSVEDLKKSYNAITKATKARQCKSKLEVASKPTGVIKEKSPKRASKSKSVSFVPEVPADRKVKGTKPRRQRTIKDEIIGAPKQPYYSATAKSQGEIQADQRFAQLHAEPGAKDEKIPRLPFYHPIVKIIIDKKEIANTHIESLQGTIRTGSIYSVKSITLSINSWVPDCTDTEQVGKIIYKALTEIEKRETGEYAIKKKSFERSHVTQKGSLWPRQINGWCEEKPLPVPGSMGLEVGVDIVMP